MDDEDKIDQNFYDETLDEKPFEKKEEPTFEPDEEKIKDDQDKFFSKEIIDSLVEEGTEDADGTGLSSKNYLYSIFSTKVDKYKSIYYLKRIHKKYLREGYPDGTILNNYLFVATVLRRLQIQYQEHHKASSDQGVPRPEDLTLLNKIETLSDKCSKIQKALDDQRNAQRSGADIHDLHQKELEDNAKFVQEHIGEFSFRCKKCDTIVNAGGLPHWAYEVERGDKGEPIYHVWSQELFYAVKKKEIPLYMMAFSLQTSIEGLKHTAEERGVKMPEYNILEEEEKLKDLMMRFERDA
jgi:hypothetical protein